MSKRWIMIVAMVMVMLPMHAETVSEMQKQASRRYSMNGIHHVGVALDAAGWRNVDWGIRAYYEVGSVRNIVNGSLGVGYKMIIPLPQPSADMLGHIVPVSLGVKCNYYVWELNSAYVGVDGTYNIRVGGDMYQSFFAVSGRLGVRLNTIDISVDYTYDLAPQFDQKYIYENPKYDFEALHASIYERMQVGVRVAYYFTIGL